MDRNFIKRGAVNVSATLRNMKVGDVIVLSSMYEGAARASASRLRKSQMLFRVEKEWNRNKVTVTRTM